MGTVTQAGGRLSFAYDEIWRAAPNAFPLSLSMPLAAREHPHAAITPFLWGLLPDNALVLERWGRQFQVSAGNPFALLGAVGEDCAGAVQFVRPERLATLADAAAGTVAWLTEADLAARLRALRADAAAGRAPGDSGQFSLAGAQPKTALLLDGQRWGVPAGRMPTTHILKPAAAEPDGRVENEHLCLALARALGLPAAGSQLRRFDGVTALVIERYDRVRIAALAEQRQAEAAMHAALAAAAAANPDATRAAADAVWHAADAAAAGRDAQNLAAYAATTAIFRVHQEDFCQALRIHPERKYQSDGGPGPRDIVALLRTSVHGGGPHRKPDAAGPAEEDVGTFLDALIFNWLIGGTDAHGKNYAMLIGGGGLVRLAPLYDLASIFGVPGHDPERVKMAMKIGTHYRLRDIAPRDFSVLALDLKWNADRLIDRLRDLARALPDALADESARLRAAEIGHPVLDRLRTALTARARHAAA